MNPTLATAISQYGLEASFREHTHSGYHDDESNFLCGKKCKAKRRSAYQSSLAELDKIIKDNKTCSGLSGCRAWVSEGFSPKRNAKRLKRCVKKTLKKCAKGDLSAADPNDPEEKELDKQDEVEQTKAEKKAGSEEQLAAQEEKEVAGMGGGEKKGMPTWGWIAIAVVVVLIIVVVAIVIMKKKKPE